MLEHANKELYCFVCINEKVQHEFLKSDIENQMVSDVVSSVCWQDWTLGF